MAIRSWQYAKQNNVEASNIALKYNIPLFLANIMINRGFSCESEIENCLHPSAALLNDPFLMKDMDRAVERIKMAIDQKEKVTIYGDYDVDGITSVSLLYRFLTSYGLEVEYYIPERIKEGYGINCTAIDFIASGGSTLIISVDTGITACKEVEYAKTLGIDCVITDHHECSGQLPKAVAVCNPRRADCNYPFKTLAGVGVVFKLIAALYAPGSQDELLNQYGELVALGTISDVMPVTGENRYIIRRGLSVLSSNREGLYHLMQAAGIRNIEQVSVFDVSFLIAPRINAAGRIGNSLRAVELLVSTQCDIWEKTSDYLCSLNNQRQLIEANIFAEADAIIQEKKLYLDQSALILWKEGWHHGVIGIVASRIKEKYGLPTILFALSDGKAKGSGRSMEPLNLYSALSNLKADYFQFGGHAMAAGVTMDAKFLPRFKQDFCAYAKANTVDTPYVNCVTIDAVLYEPDFTLESFKKISFLEPYGMCNEVPMFCVKNAIIRDIKSIGNQRHLRLSFQIGSKWINAVYFGMRQECFAFEAQSCVDVIFQASVNEFRGKYDIQMIVKGIRPYEKKYLQMSNDFYAALKNNIEQAHFPDRNVISNIYRFCRKSISDKDTLFEFIDLPVLIKKSGFGYYDIQKILLSLQVLEQIGVLQYLIVDQQLMLLSVDASKKASLEQSELYRQMGRQ